MFRPLPSNIPGDLYSLIMESLSTNKSVISNKKFKKGSHLLAFARER